MGRTKHLQNHRISKVQSLRDRFNYLVRVMGNVLIPDFSIDRFNSRETTYQYSLLRKLLVWYFYDSKKLSCADIAEFSGRERTDIWYLMDDFRQKLSIKDKKSMEFLSMLEHFLELERKRIEQKDYLILPPKTHDYQSIHQSKREVFRPLGK